MYNHGHTRTHWPQLEHEEVRNINFHLLTINAPLIVKDDEDKVFELILFQQTKIL